MFPLLETAIAFAAAMLTASLLVSALVQAIQKLGMYRADIVSGMLRSVMHGFRSFYNDPDLLALDYPVQGSSQNLDATRRRVFAGETEFVNDILADPALHARGDALAYGDEPARQAQYVEYISAADLIAIARNHAESAVVSESSDAPPSTADVSSPTPPPAESGSITILTRPGDELRFLPASWLFPPPASKQETQPLPSEKAYATLAKFAEYVQHWFPTFEATATQTFRTKIRRLTLVVACSLVVLLNIDSVRLAVTLYRNSGGAYAQRIPELKEQASRLGVTSVDLEPVPADSAAVPAPDAGLLLSALDDPTLGLGWQGSAIVDTWCAHTGKCPSTLAPLGGWQTASATILWLVGLVLSCALLSLGAPFWYNALAGLLNLRNALQTKNEKADAAKAANPAQAAMAPSPRTLIVAEVQPAAPAAGSEAR